MPTTFDSTILSEKGTGVIECVFTDEDGASVIPNGDTIQWTLTNQPAPEVVATIINSREQVDIASAATINIVLSGLDLAMLTDEANDAFAERVITVEYEYDSTYGSNLPGKGQHIFRVENLYYPT